MGCSRSGALAIVCVLLAGALTILSLVLPYWSKLRINLSTNEHEQIEISYGLWSSCIDVHLPVETIDNSHSEAFICGSYYHSELVEIHCTSFQQFSMGQCTKTQYKTNASLCQHDQALSFLGQEVITSIRRDWLSFLDRACGSIGHASVSFAIASAVGTGLSFVLLLMGITCASIESCLGTVGGWCCLLTSLVQVILSILWITQVYVIKDTKRTFATSFYLNIISLVLLLIAFKAVKSHQRLVQEAQAEAEVDLPIEFQEKETKEASSIAIKIEPIELEPV